MLVVEVHTGHCCTKPEATQHSVIGCQMSCTGPSQAAQEGPPLIAGPKQPLPECSRAVQAQHSHQPLGTQAQRGRPPGPSLLLKKRNVFFSCWLSGAGWRFDLP